MRVILIIFIIIGVAFGCYKAEEMLATPEKIVYTESQIPVILDDMPYLDEGLRNGVTLTNTFFRTSGTTDNWYSNLGRGPRVFQVINLYEVDSIQYIRTSPGIGRFGTPGNYTRMANYDVRIFYKDSTSTSGNYLVKYTVDNFTETQVSGGLMHPNSRVKLTTFIRNDRQRISYTLPYRPQTTTWKYKYIRSADGVYIDEEFKEPENSNQNFWQPENLH